MASSAKPAARSTEMNEELWRQATGEVSTVCGRDPHRITIDRAVAEVVKSFKDNRGITITSDELKRRVFARMRETPDAAAARAKIPDDIKK